MLLILINSQYLVDALCFWEMLKIFICFIIAFEAELKLNESVLLTEYTQGIVKALQI